MFPRAALQFGIGVLVGGLFWVVLLGDRVGLLLATAGVLTVVGAAACGVPVRRALRIEPTEALREVG